MKPTVLIADDHPMFLDGLRGLLSPHYEIIGEAGDGKTLIGLAMEKAPDIIVSDFSMPGMNGLAALRDLAGKGITSKFILLTMHAEPEYAAEAMAAGASGQTGSQKSFRQSVFSFRFGFCSLRSWAFFKTGQNPR